MYALLSSIITVRTLFFVQMVQQNVLSAKNHGLPEIRITSKSNLKRPRMRKNRMIVMLRKKRKKNEHNSYLHPFNPGLVCNRPLFFFSFGMSESMINFSLARPSSGCIPQIFNFAKTLSALSLIGQIMNDS
jgi:hypothetical protein